MLVAMSVRGIEQVNAESTGGCKFVGDGERSPNRTGTPTSGLRTSIHTDDGQLLKSLALFYGIACGFAWLAWTPLVLGPAGLRLNKYAVSLPVSVSIGTLGPAATLFHLASHASR
jgi:hypothetical protein